MSTKASEQKEEDNDDESSPPCCVVNKVYLVSKGFYFFFFSAQGSLLPYLALFFKQLELPATQVGAITGFKPYIAFFFIPFWGCIADRYKKGKVLFVVSMLAVISGMVAYALVPINICEIDREPSGTGRRAIQSFTRGRAVSTAKHPTSHAKTNFTKVTGKGRPIVARNSKEPQVGTSNHELLQNMPQRNRNLSVRPSMSHLISAISNSPKNENQNLPRKSDNEFPDKITMIVMKSRGSTPGSNSTSYDAVSEMADESVEETPWSQSGMIALQDQAIRRKGSKKNTSLFLYLLVATVVSTILSCPSLTLADTATVNLLKSNDETHKYGKQRLWGSIGYGAMAFTVGAAVSRTHLCPPGSERKKDVNYYPCFAMFVMCNLIALIIGSRFQFKSPQNGADGDEEGPSKNEEGPNKNEDDPSPRNKRGVIAGLKLITQPQHAMFLMTAFYVGITMGFIRVFLFWHLKDLGGTQLLFSIMAAINCIAEVTLYFLSSKLISYIGTIKVLYLGLTCYALRLFYYAFVSNPWTVLPVELLSGITTAAVWAAMMSYVGTYSVEGASVTLQGKMFEVDKSTKWNL